MRKLIVLSLALLLPLFASDMNADENKQRVIPLKPEESGWLQRDSILPIESVYYGMLSAIVTSVTEDLGEVDLSVTNLSTGEVWYDSFDSGAVQQILTPISSSPGFYEVVYTTASGDVYQGIFNLK